MAEHNPSDQPTADDEGQGEGANLGHSADCIGVDTGRGRGEDVRRRAISREGAVLERRAIRGGWITDDIGRKAALRMERILDSGDALTRDAISAARTVATLAAVDVRREQAQDQSLRHEDNASLAALRAILATPEGRQALAQLSARPAQGETTPPVPSTPPTKCSAPESTSDTTSEEAGDGD